MWNAHETAFVTSHQTHDEPRRRDERHSLDDSETPFLMHVLGDPEHDTVNNAKSEAKLVQRLDKHLMAFAMLGNLVKALDNNNLGSAFISGMEEELNITGLQYNWMSVIFMAGYLVMQIPSNMMLSKLRPSIYLPFLELIWSILTLSMAFVTSVKGVYTIRLLLGLAEAGFYPGIVFLIGTWYTKRELGKRMALLTVCAVFGNGLSGVVQAIMLKTMDGVMGISGWRWMFVFDAFLTAVMAWYGRKYLPDYPHNTSWLTNTERHIALQRLDESTENNRTLNRSKGPSTVVRMLKNKYIYLFVISWASVHLVLGVPTVLGIVAKKLGFDPVYANLLTTPCVMLTMFSGLCNGFLSDRLHSRFWCIFFPALLALFGCSMLSLFVQPFGYLYAAFICTHMGIGSGTSIIMTWASEIMAHDISVRALTIATMNTFSSVMALWTPLVLWPVTDAPRYHRGFTTCTFFIALYILSISLTAYLHRQDSMLKKSGRKKQDDRSELSKLEDEKPVSPLLQNTTFS